MTCILESPPPLTRAIFSLSFPFVTMYNWKHGKINRKKFPCSGYNNFITVRGGESKRSGTKSSKKLYAFIFCLI